MIEGLVNHLRAGTGIDFAFMSWSHAPDHEYGVVTLSDQEALKADADPIAEKMPRGYVDLFTRDRTWTSKNAVEDVLQDLGIWFELESIQFEEDTGYIHYEWTWADTTGAASVDEALIRFDLYGQITEAWLPYGANPTPPAYTPVYDNVSGATNGGVWVVLAGWKPEIKPVNGNAVYRADLSIAVRIYQDGDVWKMSNGKENSPISSGGIPTEYDTFTQPAYDLMTAAFGSGISVTDQYDDGAFRYRVKSIDGQTAVVVDADGNEIECEIQVQ